MSSRHRAGQATYNGDCRHIVGEVKGPSTYGSDAVATNAYYDEASDKTLVNFSHLSDEDQANVYVDDQGVRRLNL